MNWVSSLFEGDTASMAWATLGGAVVALGLAIEKFADFLNERFLGGYKAHKCLESAGWWVLMLGIWVEIADAGWTSHEIMLAKQIASESDIRHKPIFALSAYAYVVVRPSERKEDLNNTNLVSFGWAEGAVLFPYAPQGEGNWGKTWLTLGLTSEMANGWSGREASVDSDCVLETIAEVGDEKMLRFDMYFGINAHDKTLPPANRSFQNTRLTPDELDVVDLSLPVRGEVMGGEVDLAAR